MVENCPKCRIWIFWLCHIENVTVARFARHVEWDFFCDFPALCAIFHAMKKLKWLLELERKFATSRFEVDTISLSKMLEKWTLRKLVSHFLSNSTFLPGSNSTFNYAIKSQLFQQSEWLPNHSFLLLKSVAKSSKPHIHQKDQLYFNLHFWVMNDAIFCSWYF